MAIGTGISAQLGCKAESVYGIAVAVDQFNDFESESLKIEDKWTEPSGLAAGRLGPLAARMVQTTRSASGSIDMKVSTGRMGRWFSQMFGQTTGPTALTGGAYQQVHQIGDLTGKSLTVQVGRPLTDGTVQPYTAVGCKVESWELSSSVGEELGLSLDLDARDLLTANALATASYGVSGQPIFHHQLCTVRIGGTVVNTSGVLSVTSGLVLTRKVKSVSMSGTHSLATDRYGTGTTKGEPLQNGQFDGSVEIELEQSSDFYTLFRAGTVFPVQVTYVGDPIASSGFNSTLELTFPAVKVTDEDLNVDGPDVVPEKATLKVLSDGTNPLAQARVVSSDSTL